MCQVCRDHLSLCRPGPQVAAHSAISPPGGVPGSISWHNPATRYTPRSGRITPARDLDQSGTHSQAIKEIHALRRSRAVRRALGGHRVGLLTTLQIGPQWACGTVEVGTPAIFGRHGSCLPFTHRVCFDPPAPTSSQRPKSAQALKVRGLGKGESMMGASRRVFFGVAVAAAIALALGAGDAGAYLNYTESEGSGNCLTCHGDFQSNPYLRLGVDQGWGASLMMATGTRSPPSRPEMRHSTSRASAATGASSRDSPPTLSPSNPRGCASTTGTRASPSAGAATPWTRIPLFTCRWGRTCCRSTTM
jgi:hypothetical protein